MDLVQLPIVRTLDPIEVHAGVVGLVIVNEHCIRQLQPEFDSAVFVGDVRHVDRSLNSTERSRESSSDIVRISDQNPVHMRASGQRVRRDADP